MEARITFRGEIFINGDNEQEIINKYEGMGLFSVEALDNISEMRCDLRIASPKIHYAIYDLMEEYWKDNELEGEWYEYVDNETDSIFFEL